MAKHIEIINNIVPPYITYVFKKQIYLYLYKIARNYHKIYNKSGWGQSPRCKNNPDPFA